MRERERERERNTCAKSENGEKEFWKEFVNGTIRIEMEKGERAEVYSS